MSFGIRAFVEFLVEEIKEKGVLGNQHSDDERLSNVEDMIWDAYEKYLEDE